MTRTDSKSALSCVQRAKIANKAKADAYLRIHANSIDSSSATGALTICVTKNNRYVSNKMYKKSYALSAAVLNAYVKATGCRKEYVWETDTMSGNQLEQSPHHINRTRLYVQPRRGSKNANHRLSEENGKRHGGWNKRIFPGLNRLWSNGKFNAEIGKVPAKRKYILRKE